MIEHLYYFAFVLALCIGCAVYLHIQAIRHRNAVKSRAQLKREIEEAERHHRRRKDKRRLYVKATAEQIRRECA